MLTQVAINSRQADNASPQLHLVESMVVALMWMVAALTCRCRPLEKSAHLIVCTSFLLLGAAQASEAPFVATATMVPSDGDPSTRMTHFGGSGVEATTPFREREGSVLCIFTLLRGGTSDSPCAIFEQSRECLREAIPSGIDYEQIAFHKGHMASDVQLRLSSTL